MKSFLSAMIIAILLVWGSGSYMSELESISMELYDVNSSAYDSIEAEDYQAAEADIDEIYSVLEKHHMFFAAMGNHTELDNIKTNLAELEVYTKSREKYDALSKCSVLSFLFEHLPANSRLRIENIL